MGRALVVLGFPPYLASGYTEMGNSAYSTTAKSTKKLAMTMLNSVLVVNGSTLVMCFTFTEYSFHRNITQFNIFHSMNIFMIFSGMVTLSLAALG